MPADQARITIARDLLAQLGVTLADLRSDGTPASTVPTLADYLPCVIASAGPGANRTYGSYWTRMAAAWGTGLWTRSRPATSKLCNTGWPRPRAHPATAATAGTPANT